MKKALALTSPKSGKFTPSEISWRSVAHVSRALILLLSMLVFNTSTHAEATFPQGLYFLNIKTGATSSSPANLCAPDRDLDYHSPDSSRIEPGIFGSQVARCWKGADIQFILGYRQCPPGTAKGRPTGTYWVCHHSKDCETRNPVTGDCEVPIKDNAAQCDANSSRHPINFSNGNKWLIQSDYSDQFTNGLRFERFYSYNGVTGDRDTEMGVNWRHSYSSSLELVINKTADWVKLTRANGAGFNFYYNQPTWNEDKSNYVYGEPAWTSQQDVYMALEQFDNTHPEVPNGWKLTMPDGTVELYEANGKLYSVTGTNGVVQTLSYDAFGHLTQVVSSSGGSLTFVHNADDRISSVTDSSDRSWTYQYDSNGNLQFVTNPDASVKQYHYEDSLYANAVTGITDERGTRYSIFSYDSDGRANMSTLANNTEKVDVLYHADGSRTVTNSRNFSSSYQFTNYLGSAKQSQSTGPDGTSSTSYLYDPETNNLLSKTVNGVTTEFGDYDEKGQYGYKIEAVGTTEERRTDYTYDNRFIGLITSVTTPSVNPSGHSVVNITYDDNRNPISITLNGFSPDTLGGYTATSRTSTRSYNGPYNQLSQIDGPRTDVSDITTIRYYDDDPLEGYNRARVKEIENAKGELITRNRQYSATGKILSEDRPNGLSNSYSYYDGNDRLETLTQSDGGISRVTRWTYLPTGEVETITSGYGAANSETITLGYDDARRITRITDGQGNYIQYDLDTEGNKKLETIHDDTGQLKKKITRVFDAYDQIDSASQANESLDYEYTPDGEIDYEINASNVKRDYSYDSLQRLTKVIDDQNGSDPDTANATELLDYDIGDRLTSVTDPNNGETTYLYDDFSNLIQQTSPDTGVTSFVYDDAGNLISRTDAKGQTFTYSYDVLNRLTMVDVIGTEDDRTYVYDNCTNGVGKLCSINQNNISTSYGYNSFGDITEHQSITYDYDESGRLVSILYPSGKLLEYRYNSAGRIDQMQVTSDGQTTVLASDIQYMPFGNIKNMTFGNGLALSYLYDSAYRFTDLNVGSILNLTNAQYDTQGNLTQRTDDGVLTTWGYDALSRLDLADGSFGVFDYDYDLNGNRRQVIDDGISKAYTYETSSNRIDFATDWSYGFDANGNTIEKLAADSTGYSYSYNTYNRLIRVDENTAASSNVRLADYVYNGLGQRVQKDNGNSVTQYHYGLQGLLLAESTGQSGREYYYMNGQPIAALHIDNSSQPLPSNAVTTIRIKNAMGQYLQIGEVIAIDADSGQDVALSTAGATASAFSNWWGSSSASAISGQWTGRFPDIYHSRGSGEDEYLEITLARPTDLASITLRGRSDCCSERDIYHLTLLNAAGDILYESTSLDASGVTHQVTVTPGISNGTAQAAETVLPGNAVTTLRIKNAVGQYLQVGEVIAIDAVSGQDVALSTAGATASAFSNWWGSSSASAISGQWTGQFPDIYHSRGSEQEEYLEVTLARPTDLASITLRGRSDCCSERDIYHLTLLNAAGDILYESTSLDASGITHQVTVTPGISNATTETAETLYYYHNDHLGTPQAMTDSSGTKVWEADYQPFGIATITLSNIENNLRFPGQYYDEESGLYYNYYRYYDPETGRYITSDPIGLKGGLNTYVYVLNNPLRWIDLLGLTAECPIVPPRNQDGWNPYGGDSSVYHCGFTGFLEDRIPNKSDPSPVAECFYDRCGIEVDEVHLYSGCRGTPDQYPLPQGWVTDPSMYDDAWNHFFNDTGGPNGPSDVASDLAEEARQETERYKRDVENGYSCGCRN